MRLRRRISARGGVSIAALDSVRDFEEIARQSGQAGIVCGADSRGEAWFEAARENDGPPVFCPNQPLIWTSRDDRRVQADRC